MKVVGVCVLLFKLLVMCDIVEVLVWYGFI